MRDDERLFSFAIQFFIITLLLVAVFHMLFDSNDKKLNAKNRELVSLEQDLSNASVRLAALLRPEILRPIVMKVHPDYKPIGTGRTISVRNM